MSDPRQSLFECLEGAASEGVFPGAVALVWRDGAMLYHEGHGVLARHEASGVCVGAPVERDTIYDLASLTKVLSTTTLVALAVAEGRLELDAAVPEDLSAPCPGARLVDVLEHRSGLPAHRKFYLGRGASQPDALFEALAQVEPASGDSHDCVYSDLGFMLLGRWLERIYDLPLDMLFDTKIARRLDLDRGRPPRLAYRRVSREAWLGREYETRVAPTEVYVDRPAAGEDPVDCDYVACRGDELLAHGRVHDDNALILDGVAGHAGLFGDAEAVYELARAWLEARLPGLDVNTRDLFWAPRSGPEGARVRRLGWDGPSPDGSGSTAKALSSGAVGHLGFTGTSLWIDPRMQSIYVLLSNRVHPDRGRGDEMRRLRREFHTLAAQL